MDEQAGKPQEDQGWQETWARNLSQIDDKLIEFFKDAGETTGDLLDSAKEKIQALLDKTDMDEKAAAGWEKAKAEGRELAAKVENRVAQLVAAGKIKLASIGKRRDDD